MIFAIFHLMKKILFHQKPHNEKYVNISIYDMEKKFQKV